MTFDPTEKSGVRVKGHTQYVVRAEEGEPGNEDTHYCSLRLWLVIISSHSLLPSILFLKDI